MNLNASARRIGLRKRFLSFRERFSDRVFFRSCPFGYGILFLLRKNLTLARGAYFAAFNLRIFFLKTPSLSLGPNCRFVKVEFIFNLNIFIRCKMVKYIFLYVSLAGGELRLFAFPAAMGILSVSTLGMTIPRPERNCPCEALNFLKRLWRSRLAMWKTRRERSTPSLPD